MKISTSSSSSSPLDLNSSEAAAAGCVSGVLRRLLCRNFHHNSALNMSSSSVEFVPDDHLKQELKKPPPSPGLVARLMGLDSMPVHPYTPTESIRRSRSANSVEGWNGILSGQKKNWVAAGHRTSQSFREEPTFLRKESEYFLVLSFDPNEKGEEMLSDEMKHKTDDGALKKLKSRRRIERRVEGKENVLGKRQSHSEIKNSKPVLQKNKLYRDEADKENSNKPRRSISAKKRTVSALKNLESESSSRDSSPVSVLDRHLDIEGEYLTGMDSPISEEHNKKPKQEKPRRKLSPELKIDSYPAAKSEVIGNSKDGGLSTANNAASSGEKSSERKNQVFSDTWGQICQLAGDELKKSCWDFREIWRSENDGEVAAVVELKILDSLVNQMLTELLSTCSITI